MQAAQSSSSFQYAKAPYEYSFDVILLAYVFVDKMTKSQWDLVQFLCYYQPISWGIGFLPGHVLSMSEMFKSYT